MGYKNGQPYKIIIYQIQVMTKDSFNRWGKYLKMSVSKSRRIHKPITSIQIPVDTIETNDNLIPYLHRLGLPEGYEYRANGFNPRFTKTLFRFETRKEDVRIFDEGRLNRCYRQWITKSKNKLNK